MDRFLAYHPESDTFSYLIPGVPADRYPQLCYNHVVGDDLYITSNNIWSAEKGRALGAVEGPIGQVMVLQSHPVVDLVIARLDVYGNDLADVLGFFHLRADSLDVDFLTAPANLFAAEPWSLRHVCLLFRFQYDPRSILPPQPLR
jgi:hypothetical protein